MSTYDDALTHYTEELLIRVRELTAENERMHSQLSEAHRQIALLEEQLVHYYL